MRVPIEGVLTPVASPAGPTCWIVAVLLLASRVPCAPSGMSLPVHLAPWIGPLRAAALGVSFVLEHVLAQGTFRRGVLVGVERLQQRDVLAGAAVGGLLGFAAVVLEDHALLEVS